MEQKENAIHEFIEMTKNSWTYERMTETEKKKLIATIGECEHCNDAIKGTYMQRWNILQAIYRAYLAGLGYDGFNWREPNKESATF